MQGVLLHLRTLSLQESQEEPGGLDQDEQSLSWIGFFHNKSIHRISKLRQCDTKKESTEMKYNAVLT
jgi:hypothetical protein